MGLGRLFARPAPPQAETRAITEFALVDGQPLFGAEAGSTSYRGAMRIPGAWRATTLISGLLGAIPWEAFRERPGAPLEQLRTPALLEQPAPPETRMNTFSSWGLDLLWNGNAVGVYAARDRAGYPTAVLPVPAAQVAVRRVGRYESSTLPVGALEYNVGGRTFTHHDILHIKGWCEPGALKGMGVLEAHLLGGALGLSLEQMRQASNLANHGVPTGYIQTENTDTTAPELRALKAGWLQSQRDRTIAALNATTKFVPLSWNPEEMQLVDARRYQLTELELIFGLPVGWLGGMNSARQYSNIEQDAVNLLKFTLGEHLARFKQALSLAFPRGTRVEPNLDDLLQADTLTRYQAHEIGLRNKFITVDEVRQTERKPPLPPEQQPDPGPEPDDTDPEEQP